MLTLITATPGSGKTLQAVQLCYEYLNKGYAVFSNIVGLKIAGVYKIDSHADWRDLDNFKRQNSDMANTPVCVIYDEAHEHPAFSAKDLLFSLPKTDSGKQLKQNTLDIGDSLTLHRHFGMDIIMITQNPRLLRSEVLAVVGKHIHMRRIFGMKSSWLYEFPEAQTNPNTRSVRDDALVRTRWKFPTHLYNSYVSAEVHTHERKVPFKYIAIALAVFCVPPIVLYSLWGKTIFSSSSPLEKPVISSDKQDSNFNSNPVFQQSSNPSKLTEPPINTSYQVNEPVSYNSEPYQVNKPFQYSEPQVQPLNYLGCIISSNSCSCYKIDNTKTNLPISECKKISTL